MSGDPIMCDVRQVIDPKELSLMNAVLRQPHGCHLEYLRNMGVTSTLTLAIVVEDKVECVLVPPAVDKAKLKT